MNSQIKHTTRGSKCDFVLKLQHAGTEDKRTQNEEWRTGENLTEQGNEDNEQFNCPEGFLRGKGRGGVSSKLTWSETGK